MRRRAGFLPNYMIWSLVVAGGVVVLGTHDVNGAGFATAGEGLRARSMGGAFRGVANDWSALSYNPAGIAFMDHNELNATLGIYNPQLGFDAQVSADGLDHGYLAADTSGELFSKDDVWPIPSLAAVRAPKEGSRWAFGAAVFWPHDVNYQWDLFRAPLGYNTDYTFNSFKNFHTDMDVMDVHPTVAAKLTDALSVGVGLSITRGDVVYRRVLAFPNVLGPELDDYPIDNFYGDYRMEGNGVGLGANAGVLWKATDKLTIGVSGQTPVTVPMEGLAEINLAWPVNSERQDVERSLYPDNDKSFFVGVNDEVLSERSYYTQDYKYDLDLPGSIAAGIGYSASDRLLLAVDVAMTFWSAVDEWKIEYADSGLGLGFGHLVGYTIPFGWDDQVRVSGGAEYMAKENLAIRGGLYYDGGAAVDSTFTPNFPDVGDRIGLTGGFSYLVANRWELGLAQEIAFASEREIPASGTSDGVIVFPGTYSLTRYETLMSISYRF